MSERMCPCGGCDSTWDQAVLDMMRSPRGVSRDQAEARLERLEEKK